MNRWLLVCVSCALACLGACGDDGGDPAGVQILGGDGDGGELADAGPEGGDASAGGDGDGDPGGDGDGDVRGDGDGDGDGDQGGILDAAVGESTCFVSDGATSAGSGAGTCADPLLVDLGARAIGESVSLVIAAHDRDEAATPDGKCGLDAARDTVLVVTLPVDTELEVSTVALPGQDTVLRVQRAPDTACKAAPSVCVDDLGAGACEYLRARHAIDFDGNLLQLLVSEPGASGEAVTLQLRLARPESGA